MILKNRFRKIEITLVLLLLISLAACAPAAQEKITIGMILPLSGTFAFYGVDQQRGAQIALDEVGNKIKIVYEDSAGENQKALSAFQSLTNVDNAKIVITSTSWISNAIYNQAADSQIFQASIASSAFKHTRPDKAVRFTNDVKEEVPYLADSLQQFNKIAIIHLNNDFGKSWAEALKKFFGNRTVAVESYMIADTDVSSQLTKIKTANPDVLILISTGRDGALIARKAKELGITTQLASTRTIESPDLLTDSTAVEGLVYSYPAYNSTHSFNARYIAKYGTEPTVSAVEAYDSIITLAKASEKCGSETTCLHQWYLTKEYDGALGHMTFDANGDAHYPFILKQVNKGKFVSYKNK